MRTEVKLGVLAEGGRGANEVPRLGQGHAVKCEHTTTVKALRTRRSNHSLPCYCSPICARCSAPAAYLQSQRPRIGVRRGHGGDARAAVAGAQPRVQRGRQREHCGEQTQAVQQPHGLHGGRAYRIERRADDVVLEERSLGRRRPVDSMFSVMCAGGAASDPVRQTLLQDTYR